MKLKQLEPIVLEILENNPKTRQDDYLLIEAVIDKFIDTNMTFKSVMLSHRELGLPSLESITRCRRKIQAGRPELVDDETQAYREEKIDDYIQYALNLGGDV